MPPTHKRIRAVDAALATVHGPRPPRERSDPLDGLIGTILSQNTTDLNSHAAFASLKKRYPTWEQARRARTTSIARAIERGGLANIKAERIKDILDQIHAERGELSLDFLSDIDPDEAGAYLLRFKGVGPKTAACVLIFNCGRPVFPVDTHVFRVATRLGWLAEKSTPESAHEQLQAVVPPDIAYQIHMNMVAHGRRLCRPSKPKCPECPVRRYCKYYREVVKVRAAAKA
ncbi:MAG: endonuclease III [Armatimonadota bacterium]|jgi:endonuclease-3